MNLAALSTDQLTALRYRVEDTYCAAVDHLGHGHLADCTCKTSWCVRARSKGDLLDRIDEELATRPAQERIAA